jgi:hypothetical protein
LEGVAEESDGGVEIGVGKEAEEGSPEGRGGMERATDSISEEILETTGVYSIDGVRNEGFG